MRTHITIILSVAALALVGCAKEKKDPASSADPTTKDGTGSAATTGGDGEVKPPKVAIGANRTETFANAKPIAETKEYAVSLALPDAVAAGKEAKAMVILTPAKGWKLNDEFPYSLKVATPDGVTVAKASQDKSDAVKWEKKGAAHWAIMWRSAVH